jgi:hypothetical protein
VARYALVATSVGALVVMCDEEREFLVMAFDHDGGVEREAWTGEVELADAIAQVAHVDPSEATHTAAVALGVLDVAAATTASRRHGRAVDALLAVVLAAVVVVWFVGLAAVAQWLW